MGQQVNETLAFGHGEGIAVASLLMSMGKLSPSDFGAPIAAGLSSSNPTLAAELAYWSATQKIEVVHANDQRFAAKDVMPFLALRAGERVVVAAAFADAESLLSRVASLDISVALIDLRLPGMQGTALMAALRRKAPAVKCIALTSLEGEPAVLEAIRAGAFGYLLKDEAAGAYPVSSRVAGVLFSQLSRLPAPALLSPREEQLAEGLAEGLSYGECAERMGVAVGTVQEYVKRLYRKLDVSSKREVRDWVAMHGSSSSHADKLSGPQ